MPQTIIIGIDGRSQDADALALARQLSDPGAEFIAASVGVNAGTVTPFRGRASSVATAEERVDAVSEGDPGTEAFAATATSVGRGLAELARGSRADLIVVASSRRGLLGRVFAGNSVADVLRHAPCPVAIAPVGFAGAGPLGQILVGYDGSPEADGAIHEAVRLAERDGGDVAVIEVVEPFVAVTEAGTADRRMLDIEYDRASTNLDRLADEHGLHGVIATGRAAHELAKASRSASLLCVGLHHHGVLDRMLIGSTVHAILREQSAPLLVIPPRAARTAALTTTDALDPIPVA